MSAKKSLRRDISQIKIEWVKFDTYKFGSMPKALV